MKNFLCMIGIHDWNYSLGSRKCENCCRVEKKVKIANNFIKTTAWKPPDQIESKQA